MTPSDLLVFPDPAAVAEAAAERFAACAADAVDLRGRFVVVLSGGSTPRRLYGLLATDDLRPAIAWDRTWILFGDERCVPPDHADSNYRSARETLLDRVPIDPRRVLRMRGEDPDPDEAARLYEQDLRALFPQAEALATDLVLLGMGEDGHTASLFPATAALDEGVHWVAANFVPRLESWRITLTFPALNGTRRVLFLVTGDDKAKAFARAFGGEPHHPPLPCELVVPHHGRREVLADEAAASRLVRR